MKLFHSYTTEKRKGYQGREDDIIKARDTSKKMIKIIRDFDIGLKKKIPPIEGNF